MKCPKCGNVTNLKESRSIGISIERYRRCPRCDHKFMTYEIPATHVDDAKAYLQLE